MAKKSSPHVRAAELLLSGRMTDLVIVRPPLPPLWPLLAPALAAASFFACIVSSLFLPPTSQKKRASIVFPNEFIRRHQRPVYGAARRRRVSQTDADESAYMHGARVVVRAPENGVTALAVRSKSVGGALKLLGCLWCAWTAIRRDGRPGEN